MDLSRKVCVVLGAALGMWFAVTRTARAQAPPPPPPGLVVHMPDKADPTARIPKFEVISVKPAKDNQTRVQFLVDGMRGVSVTTRFLLFEGFGGINQDQVVGEPKWADTDGFDVDAKVAEADMPALAKLTFEQRRTMFQQILAERFKLVAHHETRELPIYRLVVSKGGPKLKVAAAEDASATAAAPHRKGMMMMPGKVSVTDSALPMFVTALSRLLGRTVVDKTGLTGNYDFTLEWTPDNDAAGATAGGAAATGATGTGQTAPGIFTAIQEQLGLKLEAGKGPVDVLVIDHMERPTEN